MNAGKAHIGYCKPCGVSWFVGANLFSSWKDETMEEQEKIYNDLEIGFLKWIE